MTTRFRLFRNRLVWLVAAALCVAGQPGLAQEDASRVPDATPQAPGPSQPGATQDRETLTRRPTLLVYVPPQVGVPRETTSGGVRSPGAAGRPQILAPNHVGLTTQPSPVLYWFLPEDTNLAVEVSVSEDPVKTPPLLTVTIPGPVKAGIYPLPLAEHGIELELETTYQCFVSLIIAPDSRAKDIVDDARIQRQAPKRFLIERLGQAGPKGQVFVYASSGFWYDAIAAVSAGIGKEPGDQEHRRDRAALLEQVGLSEAAAYDRKAGP